MAALSRNDEFRTLILHLERAEGRKAQVEDIIRKSPYPADIVDAVDGAALPPRELAAYQGAGALMRPAYPFRLNPGEIGCFLSHRRAWQKILELGLEGALIVEDDAFMEPDVFLPALRLAEENIADLGYVKFDTRPLAGPGRVACRSGSAAIVRPRVVPLRTSCQLVSRGAAERLLAASQRFDRPVDVFLQLFWETGVPIHCANPSGLSDRTQETGGSTLSRKLPWREKLRREYSRALYRARIARLSARMIRRESQGGALTA